MTRKPQVPPDATALDLRGRQSVRATFKLSARAIEALSLVACHLGIKQKSLFDHLIDDVAALRDLAGTIRIRQFNKIIRVQKTYVMSRRTLDSLELIARDHDTPRDALVEYSIQRLESLIQQEKKRHEIRKAFFREISEYFDQGREILARFAGALGDDDPFCMSLSTALGACHKTRDDLAAFIEKSSVIETY